MKTACLALLPGATVLLGACVSQNTYNEVGAA
jgi:hypothetical protein